MPGRLFREQSVRAVLGWLTRLGVPRSDRLDLAQEILLSAFTSLSRYDPGRAAPERWMNRIAVHVAAHDHGRERHRREVLLEEALNLAIADERPGAEDLIESEQQRRLVRSWLDALAPEHRALLLDRHVEEIPMAEIARRRGLPLSTTYEHHRPRGRSLREARRAQERAGVAHARARSSAALDWRPRQLSAGFRRPYKRPGEARP
ncbi:RNA polymerase sigma factor [Sorangium sp. So ce134]